MTENKKCSTCDIPVEPHLEKCPKCGGKPYSIPKDKNYQAPIPVPERPADQGGHDALTEEVEYLSKKMKLMGAESVRLHSDLKKLHNKKEAFGKELSYLVASHLKGRFVLLKIVGIGTVFIALISAYFFVTFDARLQKHVDARVAEKFASISSDEVFKEILTAASTAMLNNTVHPEIQDLKMEIQQYRNFLTTSKASLIEENNSLITDIDREKRLSEIGKLVNMAVKGSRKDYLQLYTLKDQANDLALKEILKQRIDFIHAHYEGNEVPPSLDNSLKLEDLKVDAGGEEAFITELISIAKMDARWERRREAIRLLEGFPASEVITEAFISVAKNDAHLEVVETAVLALGYQSGRSPKHPFDFESVIEAAPEATSENLPA